MTEKELIAKIQELRQIKPNNEWVLLTKRKILREERKFGLFLFFRPVYAGLSLLILAGLLGFSQKALPGESLYLIKRLSEKTQAVFVSEEGKTKLDLELTNKRLEELNQIAKNNEVKKLAPAMNELRQSTSEAAKSLTRVKKLDKEIVEKTQKIDENKKQVESVLGVKLGNEEYSQYDEALSQIVEEQIKDLKSRTLTPEQEEFLQRAEKDFEAGNYSEALIKIWTLSQK